MAKCACGSEFELGSVDQEINVEICKFNKKYAKHLADKNQK